MSGCIGLEFIGGPLDGETRAFLLPPPTQYEMWLCPKPAPTWPEPLGEPTRAEPYYAIYRRDGWLMRFRGYR